MFDASFEVLGSKVNHCTKTGYGIRLPTCIHLCFSLDTVCFGIFSLLGKEMVLGIDGFSPVFHHVVGIGFVVLSLDISGLSLEDLILGDY